MQAFSPAVRDVFERFELHTQIDLHPDRVSNMQMGLVFEELIRKFAEISNETAGEHFTPREVIHIAYTYKGEATTIAAVTADFCPACDESITDSAETERVMQEMQAFNRQVNAAMMNYSTLCAAKDGVSRGE